MKSISLKTKVITGIITGGMLLSSVSLAFATTTTKAKDTNVKANSRTECKQPKAELESTLKLGVSSKIITQSESDKILAYKNNKIKVKTGKPDFYKELVDNKILTQVKADALEASAKIQRETQMKKNMETNLAKLVTDKTITQDQADKIKATMIKEEAAKKAEMEKVKNMTEAQRTTYKDSTKANHVSALKSLVDDGTITQSQADKVGSCCFGGPGKGGKNEFRKSKAEKVSTIKLAKLVTDKTITQDQADKIKAAIIKEEVANKAAREKVENMTEAQRTTYMGSIKAKHVSVLKALVDNGTITQAQADKVVPGANKHMQGLNVK